MPSLMLIMNLSSVAVIWFGGHLVDNGDMQIGDLTAFLAYIMQILFSVMMAVMMIVMVPRAAASAERIQAVLRDRSRQIHDPVDPVPSPPGRAAWWSSAMSSSATPAPRSPVLCDVVLTLRPGRPPRSSAAPARARRR